MNIKTPTLFSIIILVGLSIFVYFFYSFSNKSKPQGINLNSALLPAEKKFDHPSNAIEKTSIKAKNENSNSKNKTHEPHQPTTAEFNARFDEPENVDLLAYVAQLLVDIQNDKTGDSDTKLATVLYNCQSASKSEAEWQQEKRRIEAQALGRGLDTGNAKTLETVAYYFKFYQDCLSIERSVSNKSAYDFYKSAADKNNGFAMVKLTKILPLDYKSFSKEEKINYTKKMDTLLNNAIDLCEPTAFESGAFALDSTDKDISFAKSSDIPQKIRQYGLFLAYETYYANHTSDGSSRGESYELKLRTETLAPYEIEAGRNYGNFLYKKACNKN